MAIRFLSGQTIDGNLTVSGNVQAATFNSLPIATGRNNQANKIVRTQGNGYVEFGWINSTSGNHTGSITRITASNDEYLRYVTPAQFRTGVTDGYYAPASTVSGVTSVATSNGLTGGTITTTGTLSMSGSYTGAFSVTGFTTSTTGFGINYVSGGTVPMVILANATTYGIFYRESSPDHIEFKHNNAVMQSFDGNGNVDIEGNLTLNNNIFTASGDLTINNPLDTNSNLIIAGRYDLGATTLSFRSGHGSNSNVWDMATILVEDDANYNGRIMFRTSPVGYGNTPTTKMTIRSSGAIAFGTSISAYGSSGQVLKSNGNTSPTWVDASTVIGGPYLPLSGGTLTGNIEMGGNSIFTQYIKNNASVRIDIDNDNNQTDRIFVVSKHNAGAELFRVQEDGKVGIGTTSPSKLLHVNGSYKLGTNGFIEYGGTYPYTINIENTASAGDVTIKSAAGYNRILLQPSTSGIDFYTGNSQRMRIDAGGDVLMGNTVVNPASGFSNQKGIGYNSTTGQTQIASTSDVATLVLGRNNSTDGSLLEFRKESTVIGNFGSNTTGGEVLLDLKANKNFRVVTNNSERIRVTSAGNVGIGTTSPTHGLEIDGADFGGDAFSTVRGTSRFYILNANNSYGVLGMQSNHDLQIRTNATTRMTIDNAGNVGIGTTSPSPKLHLQYAGGSYGSDSTSGFINEATTGRGTMRIRSATDQPAELFFDVNGAIRWDISCRNGTSPTLNFYPQAASPSLAGVSAHTFELQQNGNVIVTGAGSSGRMGIGTTSPAGKLDVIIPSLGTSSGNEVNGVFIQGSRHDWIFKQIRTANGSDWNNTTLRLQTRVDTTLMSSIDFVTDSSYNRHIDINTASNSFNTRFTHGGNVGIGTNDPFSRLQVGSPMSGNELTIGGYYINGGGTLNFRSGHPNNSAVWNMARINVTDDGNYNGRIEFRTTTSGGNSGVQPTTKMVLKANGRLGIGTTSPAAALDIQHASAPLITRSTNNNAIAMYNEISGGYSHLYLYQINGGAKVVLSSNGNSYFNGGSLGIGTTSPSYTLDAAGTIRATGDVIAYSDARVKDNVKTIDNALEKVKKLRGVSYTRNDIEDKSTKVGVIAQEVLKVLPEVVDQDENDKYSVSYGNITGVLIEAIKEQQKQIEYLKIQIKNMSKDN